MSKPFDATLKQLIDAHAADWAQFLCARLGVPCGPAEVLDTDLSATAQADKVFRLDGAAPFLLHLELDSGGRLGQPRDLLRYNVLLDHRHELPVHSVVILLNPRRNPSDLTGHYRRLGADGRPYHEFRYAVVRLWQERFAPLLTGELGLVPLALLTDEAARDLPAAFRQVDERLRGSDPAVGAALQSATYFLLGVRYDEETILRLYGSVTMLEESSTYQATLRRGEVRALRQTLLRQGRKRFGDPSPETEAALGAIEDRERLERLTERLLDVATWDELLATA